MNDWGERLIGFYSSEERLREEVHALFRHQRSIWKEFRDNEAMLAAIKVKAFSKCGHRIVVQANPRRAFSTYAKTDAESIAARACFLCPEGLPALEKGIAFGNYIILPNPYPILKYHVTIALREHTPQRIEGRMSDLCSLCRALGPEMFVTYNGPRCGASAPDHMHFQAALSKGVPIFEQLSLDSADNSIRPLVGWGRRMLIARFTDAYKTTHFIKTVVDALKGILDEKDEPMMNIVARYFENQFNIVLFPRAKHRSSCYFAPPHKRISISPAAMEMAGIVVVADERHFERVDEDVLTTMYEEVTLEETSFIRLVETVV